MLPNWEQHSKNGYFTNNGNRCSWTMSPREGRAWEHRMGCSWLSRFLSPGASFQSLARWANAQSAPRPLVILAPPWRATRSTAPPEADGLALWEASRSLAVGEGGLGAFPGFGELAANTVEGTPRPSVLTHVFWHLRPLLAAATYTGDVGDTPQVASWSRLPSRDARRKRSLLVSDWKGTGYYSRNREAFLP